MLDDDHFGEEADGVDIHFCENEHLHIILKDGGAAIANITMDLEAGLDLVDGLLRQLAEMSGMMFVLVDPKEVELEEDSIGETKGNC